MPNKYTMYRNSVIKATLRTRCGCTQVLEVTAPAPPTIRMALKRKCSPIDAEKAPSEQIHIEERIFRLTYCSKTSVNDIAEYEEV